MIVSRREKTVLYAAVAIVALAGIYYLFLKPFEDEMASLGQDERNLMKKKAKVAGYLKNEARYLKKVQEIEEIIPKSTPEEMAGEFQVHLRQLADKAHLTVTDNKYLDQVTIMERYKKMVFNIRFECDVQQLRDYLYYLETSRRLLRISQLDIVQRTKGKEKLSVNMRLSTLVLAQ